jgi:hypothetical protein
MLFFRHEAQIIVGGRLQCCQTGDGARRIPPELELQGFGELPEGGHGAYSAPS